MIEVSHLTKSYGDHLAVSDMSFTIEKGHIYGFLGPNGAGKSTTMNIMTGCLAATSGEVKIGGFDIFEHPKEAKKLIGYLPELPPLYVDQTVREYLTFVARGKGFGGKALMPEVERVASEASVTDVLDRLIKHLSKGYRQRVGVAQALIGDPEVIILDEPTVGLDPMQIIEIRELIRHLGENHTVILSSHILSEVQAICDEILIIHHGKLVAFDKPENLSRALASGNSIEISADVRGEELGALLGTIPEIQKIEVKSETEDGCDAAVSVGDADLRAVSREIFRAFSGNGKVLTKLNPIEVTLENIFIELMESDENLKDPSPAAQEDESSRDAASSETGEGSEENTLNEEGTEQS